MNASSTYLSHIDGFSDVYTNAISSNCSLHSFSLSVPTDYYSWYVRLTVFSVRSELMYAIFCWPTSTGASICRSPSENVAYEFVPASPTVTSMSCSFFLCFVRQVAVQLLSCGVLFLELVENTTQ